MSSIHTPVSPAASTSTDEMGQTLTTRSIQVPKTAEPTRNAMESNSTSKEELMLFHGWQVEIGGIATVPASDGSLWEVAQPSAQINCHNGLKRF